MRVGLQLIFLINNFDPGVNKAKATKGAAEDGSPGTSKLKLERLTQNLKLKFYL